MTDANPVRRVGLPSVFAAPIAALLLVFAVSHESRAEAPDATANPRLLWTYDAGG